VRIFALCATLTWAARTDPGPAGIMRPETAFVLISIKRKTRKKRIIDAWASCSILSHGPQSRSGSPAMPDGSATAHLYRPKLATVVSEGYNFSSFRCDMIAALTVAIVAVPLSMAIAVASGVSPERGLYAAVIGGFLVSALGGSRHQIGGPAGAFIVLVAATVTKFGLDGLLLTVLSGFMLTLIGLLRLGSLIRYIPHAVTVGFTRGIAVTIFASQIKDLGGLKLPAAEPGQLLPKLAMLGQALPTISPAVFAIGAGSAALIFLLRRLLPSWPGMLIAVVLA
jgi:SulP family sulfate permease